MMPEPMTANATIGEITVTAGEMGKALNAVASKMLNAKVVQRIHCTFKRGQTITTESRCYLVEDGN